MVANISPQRESQGKVTHINLKSGCLSHGKLYIVGPGENNTVTEFIRYVWLMVNDSP